MREAASYTLFDTAIGHCLIAWSGEAVVGFALPGPSDEATAGPSLRQHPRARLDDPPPMIADAIDGVRSLLAGEGTDLSFISVDLSAAPDFERRVYEALRGVPPGMTITYGELAARVGAPGAARAVGMAMGRNPIPVIIPCHRVLAGGGGSGGFSAPGGIASKFRLLEIEGAGRDSGMLFEHLPLTMPPSSART